MYQKFLSKHSPFKVIKETTKDVVFASNDNLSEAVVAIEILNKCKTLDDFEELVSSEMYPVMNVLEDLIDSSGEWIYEDDPMWGEDYDNDDLPF